MLCKIFGKMDVVGQCKKKFKARIQIKNISIMFCRIKKTNIIYILSILYNLDNRNDLLYYYI